MQLGATAQPEQGRRAFGKPSKWRCWQVKSPSASIGWMTVSSDERGDRAPRVWCGGKNYGANTMAPPPESRRESRRLGLPELFCGNAELLDLDVQGLVVDPEEPRRLALVPPRGLKGQADRLALRFCGGPARDLPQGGAPLFSWPVARSRHCADHPSQFADHCG